MTHEEAWAYVNRQISAETGGPFVVPPWLKTTKEKEDIEDTQDDERPGCGTPSRTPKENDTHTGV